MSHDVIDIATREPPIDIPVAERQEEVIQLLEETLEQARSGMISGVWVAKQYTDTTTEGLGAGRCHTRAMVGLMEEQKAIWFRDVE